ncbi:MAG: hypothetical protein ACYS8X_11050 [Planctomycetota bacterium]|jgi:hypothetical protein
MGKPRHRSHKRLVIVLGAIIILGLLFGPFLHQRIGQWLGLTTITAGMWQCNAENSMSVCQSTSSSGRAPFDARRIAVLCRSDHRMMKAAAGAFVRELTKLPFVEAVELHQSRWPEHFDKPPGLFVVLDLNAIFTRPAVGGMSISAMVSFDVGDQPWINYPCERRPSVPATVRATIQGTIAHRSTNRGAGAPGSVFDTPGKGIGEQIVGTVVPALADLAAKHGLMSDLPEAFFGRADDAPLREALGAAGFDHVVTYHPIGRDLLCYFTFTAPGDEREVFAELRDRLATVGFEGYDVQKDNTTCFDLRRHDLEDALVFFDESHPSGWTVRYGDLAEGGGGPFAMQRSTDDDAPRLYVLRYERYMPPERTTAAVAAFIEQADTAGELLMFWAQAHHSPLRKTLLSKLEALPSMDPASRLELASIVEGHGDHASARRHLRIAVIDTLAIFDNADLKKQAKKLAEKLGDESLADFEPTADDLRQAGYTELSLYEPHQTVMTLDRTERFFSTDNDGNVLIAAVTVSDAVDLDEPYAVSLLLRPLGNEGSIHTCGGYDPADGEFTLNHGYDNQHVTGHIRRNPDGQGFELTITATVDTPQSPAR